MSSKVALLLTFLYIAFLIIGDKKRGNSFSRAMWIPLAWLLIISSRGLSLWFPNAELTGNAIDGTPLDRNVFLFLIVAGCFVLVRRHVQLGAFIKSNRLLVIFFVYLGLSVLWSDFTFIAFKRWIKDIGNIVIALVVLTESDPMVAVRSLLARCAYFLVPLSTVFIRYFPDIGRYYDQFVWSYSYGGVTLNKNNLGATLTIGSIGVFLTFLECRRLKIRTMTLVIFAIMTLYVYHVANCSTALVTTVLTLGLLWMLQIKAVQLRAEQFGLYALVVAVIVTTAQLAFNVGDTLAGLVGRNLTFTGRTDIWQIVLGVHINSLIGVGYWSFWMGNRVDWLSYGYPQELLEAHNGYIETYVNSGLIGVGLLLILLLARLRDTIRNIGRGDTFAILQFSIILLLMVYNFTESIYNRFGPVWFVGLIGIVHYPRMIAFVTEQSEAAPGMFIVEGNQLSSAANKVST